MAKANPQRATGARTATADGEFARRFVEGCFNGDLAVIDDVMEPISDQADAWQGEPERYDHVTFWDPERLKGYLQAMHTAFPDLAVAVQDTMVDGDDAAMWWTAQGTHENCIGRFEPTDRRVKLQGASVCTIGDGVVQAVQIRWNLWVF